MHRTFLLKLYCCLLIVFVPPFVHAQIPKQFRIAGYHSIRCDSTSLTITAHLTFSTPMTGNWHRSMVVTDYGDGSALDTYAYTVNIPTTLKRTHSYISPGRYTIKHFLSPDNRLNPTTNPGWPYWPMSPIYFLDTLVERTNVSCNLAAGGDIYSETNNNCKPDSVDCRIGQTISIRVDSASIPIDTIRASGLWRYYSLSKTPTSYSFANLTAPSGYTLLCPNSGTISSNYHPDSLCKLDQHFAFQCSSTPTTEYSLGYSRVLRAASSGGNSHIILYVRNSSCYIDTGTITLCVSPKYHFSSASIRPTPSSINGHTITWNHSRMVDGVINQYYVGLTPLATTAIGDTACNYAIVTPLADGNPTNNIVWLCDSVRSSWDPNAKSVVPEGIVSPGTALTYTVDFENKGNDTAFHIYIQDTLSAHLDASSFELVSTTHRVEPYRYELSDGKQVLKLDFTDIGLAGKTDTLHNKGQVIFKVRLRDGLADGTEVLNRAGIYFDGNPVVLTNYTFNRTPVPEYVELLGKRSGLKVFPNPVINTLNVEVLHPNWKEAALRNVLGTMVLYQKLNRGNNVIGLAALPEGVYHLEIRGADGIHYEKVLKQ